MLDLDFGPVLASLDQLLFAVVVSVWIGVLAMALAMVIGTVGAAISQLHSSACNRTVMLFVDIFRGTPLLVQILVFYFVPTALGFGISPFISGTLSLALYFGAYIVEIMRGAFESVPVEHLDAARSLGMKTSRIFFRIQIPQVLAVVISPLLGQFGRLFKSTSLLAVIGVAELTHRGQFIMARTYAPIETWLVVAAIYFVINSVVVLGAVWLEQRLVKGRA